MTDMLSEFQKIDNLIESFIIDFEESITKVFNSHFPGMEVSDDILDEVEHYATTIYHYAHSVIKKDKEYNDFKINEELKSMNKCIERLKSEVELDDFYNEVHQKAKSVLVKYFNDIVNLSSEGFIILERYSQFALMGFVSTMKKHFNLVN